MRDGVFQTEGGLWGGCVNGKRIRVLSRTKAAAIYEVRQARLQLGAKPYIGENPMTNGTKTVLIGAVALSVAGIAIYFLTRKPAAAATSTTTPTVPGGIRTTARAPIPQVAPAIVQTGITQHRVHAVNGQTYGIQLTLPGVYDMQAVQATLAGAGFSTHTMACSAWVRPTIPIVIHQGNGFDQTVQIPDPTAVNDSLSQSCTGTFTWIGPTGPFPTSLPGIPSIVVS